MRLSPTIVPAKQSGASLVEVLVAVLVLSLGIVAMAGIHSTSLKMTRVNQFRLSASQVAEGLGEVIKANPRAAMPPNQLYNFTATGVPLGNAPPACTNAAPPPALVCAPAAIAAIDIFNARQTAARTLPQGDIFVQFNPPAAGDAQGAMSIWVYWATPTAAAPGLANLPANMGEGICPAPIAALNPPRACVRFLVPV